jgi:hypothetical protein
MGFTPSTLPAETFVVATCTVCGGTRYPSRALMIEKAGDVPLERIEPRLRCIERRGDKRGPACGGRMTIGLASTQRTQPEANAAFPGKKEPAAPKNDGSS